MADYIYLLENRLSPAQRSAIEIVREVARNHGFTIFLVGGAVRDLTTGSPVRDLDLVVQGNALKLKKDIEIAGGTIVGESTATESLYVTFPPTTRMEIGSTLSATFPKPGKPVYKSAPILDDLRRRDFTANAMALSLNTGSWGLLMDPLNGVADIENRELRLVSNYGFIEDPVRMIRAARLMARLGWQLEEKTLTRYETGRDEGYIAALSDFARGYETEEIFHEEDPLRVVKRLESDGWLKFLAPFWTSAKVNVADLEKLRDFETQLQLQGIHPDPAAANFPLLTAKLSAVEISQLKQSFPRPGFVAEVEALDARTKEFGTVLTSKAAATPSQAWKLIMAAPPEVVLWLAFSTRSTALQAKFKSFLTEWPLNRQKIPNTLMQEMRIVPELPGYNELVESLFFELMDGKLSTTEELKAFLEPHSPPAPPPPVNLRRLRAAAKKEAKSAKGRKKAVALVDDDEDSDSRDLDDESDDLPDDLPDPDEGSNDLGTEEDSEESKSDDAEDSDSDDGPEPPPVKAPKPPKSAKQSASSTAKVLVPAKSAEPQLEVQAEVSLAKAKPAPLKATPEKAVMTKAVPMKSVLVVKAVPPVKTTASRPTVSPVSKTNPKANLKKPASPAKKLAAKKVAVPTKKTVPSAAKKPAKKIVAVKAPAKPIKKVAPPAPKKPLIPAKKTAPVKSSKSAVSAKKKR